MGRWNSSRWNDLQRNGEVTADERPLSRFSRFAAVGVAMLGATVLCGWAFGVAFLRGPVPGLVEMKPNTALAFVLCGLSVLCLASSLRPAVVGGAVMAVVAAAIGAATLAEYAFAVNLGIDELLFDDVAGAAHTVHPGRPAPQTAISFLLAGVALLCVRRNGPGARRLVDVGCAAIALVSMFGLLGYAYGAGSLATVSGFTPIALHTAIGLLGLSAAIATAGADSTVRHLMRAGTVGAAMARRLLPLAAVGLPLAGWLRLEGERAGLYGGETGVALLVIAFFVVFSVGVVVSVRVLDREESHRRDAAVVQGRLAAIVESSSDAIVGKTLDGRVTSWNGGAEKLYGYKVHEMIGESITILAPAERPDEVASILDRISRGERVESMETVRRTKDGREIDVSLTASPIRDASGTIVGASAIGRDITELRRVQDELVAAQVVAQQAVRDPLTGLPNRTLFLDRLGHALAADPLHRTSAAVLFVDLDAFKRVNDSLGHHGGDQVLLAVADRLTRAVRPNDTVSRLGGDEFTVLCAGVSDPELACAIAERIGAEMAAPIEIDGTELVISASIGIALSTSGDLPDVAVRQADAAMYAAKSEGGARHHFFSESIGLVPAETLGLESDLRRALAAGQFEVVYQPQVDLNDGSVVAAEALLRWRHPERGMISPADFIPLAETTGLIVPIGMWVLEQALEQLRAWDAEHHGEHRIDIAVNLSPRQIRDPSLVESVRGSLERTGIEPGRLHLEITETVLLEDTRTHITALQGLRHLGVRLVLDDFGTGFSSLNYLKRFPLDVVKIDRSFVDGLPNRRDDVAIVTAVLAFADALDLQVVAEGLETPAHLEALKDMGCAYAQGFYFSRPLPPAEIGRLLQQRLPVRLSAAVA